MSFGRIVLGVLLALGVSAAGAADPTFWKPPARTSFSIYLSAQPKPIVTPAKAVILDLFDTPAATVAGLKRQGKHAICYLSAGTWENWRPDRSKFPARVLGKPYDGWPGERWLDIRQIADLAPIMRARLALCRSKGFHGVDPDNIDVYAAQSGFPLTRAHAIAYMRFLAHEAHLRGLAIGLKNVPELSGALLPVVQYAVTEDCFAEAFCAASRNFVSAGKPVFAIEYTDNRIDFAAFCRQAKSFGLSPLLKQRNLGVWERRCPV